MNNKIKSAALAIACLGMSYSQTEALRAKNIPYIATPIGLVAGAGAGYVAYKLTDGTTYQIPVTLLAAVGGGGLTGWAAYQIMTMFTPEYRFTCAESEFTEISRRALVAGSFETEMALIKYINAMYSSNWPLVDARESLTSSLSSLGRICSNLREISAEAATYPESCYLCPLCDELLIKITPYYNRIAALIDVIVNHDNYNGQVKLREKHMEAERQRQHELNLQNQKLNTKVSMQNSEQKFKEKLVDKTSNRPTKVNINI